MADTDRAAALLQVTEQIESEIHSLELVLGQLPKTALSRDLYSDMLHRMNYIQTLFDRASDLQRDLILHEDDPALYQTLECKERIQHSYAIFNRMRGFFTRVYGPKDQEHDDVMERTIPPSGQSDESEDLAVDESDMSTETDPEEDLSLEEEDLLTFDAEQAEKAERASKKKAAAKKRQEAYARSEAQAQETRERLTEEEERIFLAKESYRQSEEQYLHAQQEQERHARESNAIPAGPHQIEDAHSAIQPAVSISQPSSPQPSDIVDSDRYFQPEERRPKLHTASEDSIDAENNSIVRHSNFTEVSGENIVESSPAAPPQPFSEQSNTVPPTPDSSRDDRFYASRTDYQDQMRYAAYREQEASHAHGSEQPQTSKSETSPAEENLHRQYSAADVRDEERREFVRREQELERQRASHQAYHDVFAQSKDDNSHSDPHYWNIKGHFDFSERESESGQRKAGHTQRVTYHYTPEGTVESSFDSSISSKTDNAAIYQSISAGAAKQPQTKVPNRTEPPIQRESSSQTHHQQNPSSAEAPHVFHRPKSESQPTQGHHPLSSKATAGSEETTRNRSNVQPVSPNDKRSAPYATVQEWYLPPDQHRSASKDRIVVDRKPDNRKSDLLTSKERIVVDRRPDSNKSDSQVPKDRILGDRIQKSHIPLSNKGEIHKDPSSPRTTLAAIANNAAIHSSLSSSALKTPISPAYEESMKFNLRMARLNYEEKRGTPAAKKAAHEYLLQRQAYADYRKDVRDGKIAVERPKIITSANPSAKPAQRPQYAQNRSTQYAYTPKGISGKGISQGQMTGSESMHRPTTSILKPQFSPDKPLHVTPEYEAAITSRMQRARSSMNTALQRTTVKGQAEPISRQKSDEVRLAMNAYIGFQRAKRAGSVVISKDAKEQVPDLELWQSQRKKTLPNIKISGSTAQSKDENLNRPLKRVLADPNANILGRKSRLRTESIAKLYMKSVSSNFSVYAPNALMMAGRKFYQMMQSGDENNALRTMENMRYYGMTAYGMTNAILHAKVVDSKALARSAASKELRNFGVLSKKSGKELSADIRRNIQTNISSKKEIRALMRKGKDLTIPERKELLSKIHEHARASKEVRLAISYQKMHRELTARVQLEQMIEHTANGKRITIRRVDETLHDIRKKAEASMAKKFGGLNRYTTRSLTHEIESMKSYGQKLKSQIKFMQAKGAALTSIERKQLLNLIQEHKAVNERLKKLIGLQRARNTLDIQMGAGNKIRSRLAKNRAGKLGGLYALRSFILRPLQQSEDAGTQGIVKFINFSTNHYVHIAVKNSMRALYNTAGWIYHTTRLDHVVHAAGTAVKNTKVAKAATRTARAVKTTMTAPTDAIRASISSKVHSTAKTATTATKDAVRRMTPVQVRTAVQKTSSALHTANTRFTHTSNRIRSAVQSVKDWGARSWIGRTYNATNRLFTNIRAGLRLATQFVKGFAIKALLVVAAFLLVVCIISVIFTNIGGVASSVIMSPEDTADGQQVNLEPYYDFLMDEWSSYQDELEDLALEKGAYKVVLDDIPAEPGNIKDILCMMAVYFEQDVDLDKNKVQDYLAQLLRDGNPFDYTITYCKCETEDCETRRVEGRHNSSCPEDCSSKHWKTEKYCPGEHEVYTYMINTLYFDDIFWADSIGNSGKNVEKQGMIDKFTITYYCPCTQCCGANGGITYTGTIPKENRTIAVDPNVIPLGSRVMIDGQVYVAEDIGGAIDGNRIDIFVSSHSEALRKGKDENVEVYWADYGGEGIQSSGDWHGWNKINRDWAKVFYNMPWSELYTGIPSITDPSSNNTDISGVQFVDGDRAGNQAIVDKAKSQLGNQGGAPYWSWYGFNSRVEWCATFVSWCANQAGVLGDAIPKFASCSLEGVPWFKEHNQWASAGDITPVAGDIIFFDWKNDGRPDHVGIVIGTDGSKVYTVEGNSSDAVRIKSYNLGSSVIYGYGLPNY